MLSKIKKYTAVFDVKVIFDDGLFEKELFMEILFNDGGLIELKNVNEFGRGDRMHINYVNGYIISFVNRNTFYYVNPELELKLYSTLIGVQLKTVMDIVENYSVICNQVENYPNLNEYKKDNEKISATRERLIEEKILPVQA